MNPIKTIRAFCLECVGSSEEVKKCTAPNCKLYPFRLGTNPFRTKRVLTEEQKQVMRERLANARNK